MTSLRRTGHCETSDSNCLRWRSTLFLVGLSGVLIVPGFSDAAELHTATIAAFNHYIAVTESQRSSDAPFLWIDGDDIERRSERDLVRRGGLLIERIETREAGRQIAIPDGLVHHWLGVVFVPGATLNQALALLQAYNRHAEIYKPYIARSQLLSRKRGHVQRLAAILHEESDHGSCEQRARSAVHAAIARSRRTAGS